MTTIYCEKFSGSNNFTFGITPIRPVSEYSSLTKQIGLKGDLGWNEKQMEDICRKSNIWNDFPDKGLELIRHQLNPVGTGNIIDLTYLDTKGNIIPAELKISGNDADSAGQLLRYIADFYFSTDRDLEWVKSQHAIYLKKQFDGVNEYKIQVPGINSQATVRPAIGADIEGPKFNEFIRINDIKNILTNNKMGLLIDESFKPEVINTVKYLNELGNDIRLYKFNAFVSDDWNCSLLEYTYIIKIQRI